MEKSGEHISFYTGDLPALVKKIKTETEKDIYLFGGGNLLTQFIDLNLLDELEIGVIPVLLGDGVHCFGKRTEWKKLKLFNHKKYDTGIMILNYRFEKP
jgi:dihydrofolate reductase